MEPPLDTYREKSLTTNRRVDLYDDRMVIVQFSAFGTDTRLTVPLKILEQTAEGADGYEDTGPIGLTWFAINLLGVFSFRKDPQFYTQPGFWVLSGFAVIGLLVIGLSFRRLEGSAFVTWRKKTRYVILKSGPDIGRYQDFIARIESQISVCRAAHLGA